jgi:hypothetical protein
MTHFLCIGAETGNEGNILGKKRVFIGKLEYFGDGDWKRREFRQTTSTHAWSWSAVATPNAFGGHRFRTALVLENETCLFGIKCCSKSGVTATTLQDHSAIRAVYGEPIHIFCP